MHHLELDDSWEGRLAYEVMNQCALGSTKWQGSTFKAPIPLIASTGDAFYHVVSRLLVPVFVEHGLDLIWTDFSGAYFETDFFTKFPELFYIKTAPAALNNSRLKMDRPLVAFAPVHSVRPVEATPIPETAKFHEYKSTRSAKEGIRERLVSLHLIVPTLNDSLQVLN
jgi:hypothetical protein